MKLECYLITLAFCFFFIVNGRSNEIEPIPSGTYFIVDKNTTEFEHLAQAHSGSITTHLRYHSVAIPALVLVVTGYPDGALIYSTMLVTVIVGHTTGISFWITSLATEQHQLGMELEVNRYYRYTDFEVLQTEALSRELQPWAENAKYHFNFIKAKYDDSHRNPPVTLIELLKDHHPLAYPDSAPALLLILQTYLMNKGPVQSIVVISSQALLNLAVYSANGQYLENSLQLFKLNEDSSTFHPVNWPWHIQAFLLRSYVMLSYAGILGGKALLEEWIRRRLERKLFHFSPV